MICFVCKGEVEMGKEHRMIPIDRPYGNVWFHRECYETIETDINTYLAQNSEIIYNWIVNDVKTKKNKK